jgi:hypothetical protein|tara:strand:- start:1966 stop:2370 length:405 start_codon:yes stop_codon:yes gene_type:complete
MKYWRVIRYWVKAKYKIGTPDIDMLLFLYSEDIFNKTKFNEFEELMSWDVNRFDQLLKNGWVHVWRKKRGKETTLYELTYKAKRLVNLIYRKLNGEEIGEDHRTNPLFRKDASFMDKVYRQSIIKLNEERKELF